MTGPAPAGPAETAMKLKYKPWMSLVVILLLLGIVGRMECDDQEKIEQAKLELRLQKNAYVGRF